MDHSELFERSTKNNDGITGVRVGIVTDNDDPKDRGRVKLRFPWREADDESHWARIATLMAGEPTARTVCRRSTRRCWLRLRAATSTSPL